MAEESTPITTSTEAIELATTSGGAGLTRLFLRSVPRGRERKIAAGLIVLSSLMWIVALVVLQPGQHSLPWCVTLVAMSLYFAARFGSDPPVNSFSDSAPSPIVRQPLSLTESFAVSYITLSALMCLWLVYHVVKKPEPLTVKRQVVDIELTSLKDFADHHDFLPGTKEAESLRKRSQLAEVNVQAKSATQKGAVANRPSSEPSPDQKPKPLKDNSPQMCEKADRQTPKEARGEKVTPPPPARTIVMTPPSPANMRTLVMAPPSPYRSPVQTTPAQTLQAIAKARPLAVPLNFPWKTVTAPVSDSKRTARASSARPASLKQVLEEVSPAEMIEMTDNDGDRGVNIWQPGGHSEGGSGSASTMAQYLKELHKRIKRAWSPPQSGSSSAQILFRLKKNGQLSSIKLVATSGDQDLDESAMKAIASCSPFKPFPREFAAEALDLSYTFNFHLDELSEVNHGGTY